MTDAYLTLEYVASLLHLPASHWAPHRWSARRRLTINRLTFDHLTKP